MITILLVNIYFLKQIFERGEINTVFRDFGKTDDRIVESEISNDRILKSKEIDLIKTDIYIFIFV